MGKQLLLRDQDGNVVDLFPFQTVYNIGSNRVASFTIWLPQYGPVRWSSRSNGDSSISNIKSEAAVPLDIPFIGSFEIAGLFYLVSMGEDREEASFRSLVSAPQVRRQLPRDTSTVEPEAIPPSQSLTAEAVGQIQEP